MVNLTVERVRRGDICMESPDTLIINDRELKITEAQRAKVVNFSKLGTGAFKQAFDYVSPNEAVDIANTLLQTEILKDKEVSLLLQDDSLVGITTKPFAFEPDQFMDRIESLKEEFNLTTDNTIMRDGYSTQVSLQKSVKFDAEVYSPGLNFTYDINGIYAHLALNRLICANGMITKTRTSSINIMNETSLERVQALLRDVQSNPDMVYASVIEDLQKAARTPASLMDLKQFKRHFSNHFGDDKAEEIFKTERAMGLFREVPENPTKVWLETARLPVSAFELYNIGTKLATHEVSSIETNVFLAKYLTQSKPLENICTQIPRNEALFEDVPTLMGNLE